MDAYCQRTGFPLVVIGYQRQSCRDIQGFAYPHEGAQEINLVESGAITHHQRDERPDEQAADDQPSVILILFLKDKKDHIVHKIKEAGAAVENPVKGALKGMGMLFTNISFWIILLYFATPSLPGWATKNWLPTLFSENLSIDMSEAGPLSTITIALSSFIGVIAGGILSDKWIQTNVRGRVYTGAIGLALTIPSLLLLGFGHNFLMIVGGGLCFGIGFGIFDANNMPILCQFISPRYRATAYGIMNMTGVFAGAAITDLLGRSTDAGNLGHDFAMLAGLVAIALLIQICFLRPKVANMTD